MRRAPAACAILALAGSAHGFIVSYFQIQPNQAIEPSAGWFFNYNGGAFAIGHKNLADGARLLWKSYGAFVNSTTWLAIDRFGGGGEFTVSEGIGDDPFVPEWNADTAYDSGGGTRQLAGGSDGPDAITISGIDGGPLGYTWGADAAHPGFEAPSAISPVNDASKDSIFFGNFILTDPNATLVGAPILVRIDAIDHLLPLDGTPDADGYRIEYERFVASDPYGPVGTGLRAFVVIPTPGAASLLPCACLALAPRRRRSSSE